MCNSSPPLNTCHSSWEIVIHYQQKYLHKSGSKWGILVRFWYKFLRKYFILNIYQEKNYNSNKSNKSFMKMRTNKLNTAVFFATMGILYIFPPSS